MKKKPDDYGVRVKNPLALPVRVELIQNFAGRGVIGQAVVQPGATLYIPLQEEGVYEVRTTIISIDQSGNQEELGEASWSRVGHQEITISPTPAPKMKRKEEERPLRSLSEMIDEMKKKEEVTI